MAFDRDHFEKPFRKLRKATKDSRELADPEHVHKLRTNTRRVEAILGAVKVLRRGEQRELMRSLKGVRRAAGAVRDMDVLTGKAAQADVEGEGNCQIQLLHHLGVERKRAAGKLERLLQRDGKAIRSGLKRGEQAARRVLQQDGREEQGSAAARVLDLSGKLRRFAGMNRRNLHEFRKEAKQLRYVLQMASPVDARLVEGLRAMQDAIGEWHDWQELVGIAEEVLAHGRACALIAELRVHAERSLDEALRVANRVRRELLGVKRETTPLRIVQATEKLAA